MATPHPIPIVLPLVTAKYKKHYFDNDKVEDLLVAYNWTGCTSISLRDQIMAHALLLTKNVILVHGLFKVMHRHEAIDEGELIQVAYIQIERTLYKFRSRPHCGTCYDPHAPAQSALYDPQPLEYGILTPEDIAEKRLICPKCNQHPATVMFRGLSKVFNMWSSVARLSILAHLKSETRDIRCREKHARALSRQRGSNLSLDRFMMEARDTFKHDTRFEAIIRVIPQVMREDGHPWDGIISKLTRFSGCSRATVKKFLWAVRSNSFSDDPAGAERGYSRLDLLTTG